MIHCLRLLCGLVVFFSAFTLHAQQMTVEQIAADPKLWPKEVKLTQAVPLSLYQNGRLIGSVQGNVGQALQVKRIEATRITAELGVGLTAVSPTVTDLLTRVTPPAPAATQAPINPKAPRETDSATASSAPINPKIPHAADSNEAGASSSATAKSPPHIETFRDGWRYPKGKWSVTSDTEVEQRDQKDGVSNASKAIPQSGKMEYRLKERYFGGKSACTTIYIMCDDGDKVERGNGYLIADALNEKGHAEVTILKVTNDKTKEMQKLESSPVNGQWIDLQITFDTESGVLAVERNGKALGSWTDPDPIKSGKDFSLGTCMTKASFKDIEVHQLP